MMNRLSDGVSAEIPDWSREAKPFWVWDPGKSMLAALRSYQRHRLRRNPVSAALRVWALLRHRWWSAVSGADIPLTAEIGGGLILPHPNGVVVHSAARIGPNCIIFQQVTIAIQNYGVPVIGGHVDLGAGSKILGAVRIEDHAVVGANAVVLKDVPRAATAVGIPARIIPWREGPVS
ncbi:serine acetyltransferase [bacterium]|nr:MAG: serine acetyltransferase [bacterium]